MIEPEVVHRQHAHPERHLGADRVKRRVERLLGNAELSQAHRHHPVAAPHEQDQRPLDRRDLDLAGLGLAAVILELVAARVDDTLECGQLREDAQLGGDQVVLGELELVGRVNLGIQ